MINSTKEWHWMDDRSDIEHKLEGWEFDVEALRASEGAFLSLDRRSPRADFTNVHPATTKEETLNEDEWCAYGGLPGPRAYMER